MTIPTKSFKYIFLVQGEGRGHMTQAIALSKILVEAGHEISHVFMGSDSKRVVPDFFHKKIIAIATELLPSTGFVIDYKGKGIQIWPTIVKSLVTVPKYFRSIE